MKLLPLRRQLLKTRRLGGRLLEPRFNGVPLGLDALQFTRLGRCLLKTTGQFFARRLGVVQPVADLVALGFELAKRRRHRGVIVFERLHARDGRVALGLHGLEPRMAGFAIALNVLQRAGNGAVLGLDVEEPRGGHVAFGLDVFQLREARVVVFFQLPQHSRERRSFGFDFVGARSRRAKVGFGLLELAWLVWRSASIRWSIADNASRAASLSRTRTSADSRSASTCRRRCSIASRSARTSRNASSSVCA